MRLSKPLDRPVLRLEHRAELIELLLLLPELILQVFNFLRKDVARPICSDPDGHPHSRAGNVSILVGGQNAARQKTE